MRSPRNWPNNRRPPPPLPARSASLHALEAEAQSARGALASYQEMAREREARRAAEGEGARRADPRAGGAAAGAGLSEGRADPCRRRCNRLLAVGSRRCDRVDGCGEAASGPPFAAGRDRSAARLTPAATPEAEPAAQFDAVEPTPEARRAGRRAGQRGGARRNAPAPETGRPCHRARGGRQGRTGAERGARSRRAASPPSAPLYSSTSATRRIGSPTFLPRVPGRTGDPRSFGPDRGARRFRRPDPARPVVETGRRAAGPRPGGGRNR